MPVCHPPQTEQAPIEDRERNYVDVPWTKERIWEAIEPKVKELFTDMLENWHIPKPPVTKDEIVGLGEVLSLDPTIIDSIDVKKIEKTWREQAKELGIPVYDQEKKCPRLKIDVLEDIEAKLKAPE